MANHPLGLLSLCVLALAGFAAAAITGVALPRLAEPAEPGDKPPYRTLAGPRMIIGAAALAVALLLPALCWLPHAWWPVWWAWSATSSCLALVDLRTTWLPRPLTHLAWASAPVGLVGAVGLGTPVGGLAVPALAAVASFLVFWTVWRFGGQLGYGDVRLAPLASAVAATGGLQVWWAALLVTAVVGLAHGLGVRHVRRRRGLAGTAFPYGPALVVGPTVGLVLTALAGS